MIILSKLADYGVIIATHLAAYPDRQVTAGTVATETRLPQATVAKVLKTLAHAGLVTAARGVGGGYRLARIATSISVAEVVAAIDGDIGLTQCSVHVDECARTTILPHAAALGGDQSGGGGGAVGDFARCDADPGGLRAPNFFFAQSVTT